MKALNRIFNLFIFSLFFILLLTSCTKEITDETLLDIKWVLTEMENDTLEFELEEEIYIEFDSSDDASGSGGCNAYFSEYSREGNEIEFFNFGATEMACGGGNILDLEQIYFDLLLKAESMKIIGNELTIKCKNGELEFVEE